MAKREKKPHDFSIIAQRVVQEATREDDEATPLETTDKKLDHAAIGRLGGLKGGKARAAKLTPEQRSEIARRAARVRWNRGEQAPSP